MDRENVRRPREAEHKQLRAAYYGGQKKGGARGGTPRSRKKKNFPRLDDARPSSSRQSAKGAPTNREVKGGTARITSEPSITYTKTYMMKGKGHSKGKKGSKGVRRTIQKPGSNLPGYITNELRRAMTGK